MKIEQGNLSKPEFSFDQDAFEVAERIKGSRLIVVDKTVIIKNAEGYYRQENEKGQYSALLTQEPGVLMGIKYRNVVLPLISTQDGSCVLLLALEVKREEEDTKVVNGPGNVGKEIGLQKGDVYRIIIEDPYEKIFRLV